MKSFEIFHVNGTTVHDVQAFSSIFDVINKERLNSIEKSLIFEHTDFSRNGSNF